MILPDSHQADSRKEEATEVASDGLAPGVHLRGRGAPSAQADGQPERLP